jgi:hypothetical protein
VEEHVEACRLSDIRQQSSAQAGTDHSKVFLVLRPELVVLLVVWVAGRPHAILRGDSVPRSALFCTSSWLVCTIRPFLRSSRWSSLRPTTAWIKVLAIDPIAVDDTATGVLVIAVVNMGIIFLQVVVLDIASAVIMIAIIVLDIHDNDLMIIPH